VLSSLPRSQLVRWQRIEECIVDFAAEQARLAPRAWVYGAQPNVGLALFGDDDLFTSMSSLDKLRQGTLNLFDVDRGHSAIVAAVRAIVNSPESASTFRQDTRMNGFDAFDLEPWRLGVLPRSRIRSDSE